MQAVLAEAGMPLLGWTRLGDARERKASTNGGQLAYRVGK